MTDKCEGAPGFWVGLSNNIKLALLAFAAIVFTHIVRDEFEWRLLVGGLAIFTIVIVGQAIASLLAIKILPSLFWVAVIAIVATWPGVPGSQFLRGVIVSVGFLPVITPLMAFAALGLAEQDIELFRSTGLRFVVIALFVFVGTYLGSALIAQVVL